MKKLIDFRDLAAAIQEYANRNFNGNFSKAVTHLCKEGVEKDAKK